MKSYLRLVVLAFVLASAMPAHAIGPVVDERCTASWAPVAFTGGTVTYRLYVMATATPPRIGGTDATPPTFADLAGPAAPICQGLAFGQWYLFATTTVRLPDDSLIESATPAGPIPFVFVASPNGLSVQP
jgi:hypothetical protein